MRQGFAMSADCGCKKKPAMSSSEAFQKTAIAGGFSTFTFQANGKAPTGARLFKIGHVKLGLEKQCESG